MHMNSRDLAERSHASNASDGPPRRIKNNGEPQFMVTKIELQSQEDSMMHEKAEHALVHRTETQKNGGGRDEATTHLSCFSSDMHTRHARTPSNSKKSLKRRLSMKIPACMTGHGSNNRQLHTLLQDRSIQAPVTVATLQELDLHAIQHNINLRIDICHDPELFFQPVSGRKGDEKRSEARRYWLALIAEFQIYSHNARSDCHECQRTRSNPHQSFEPRLSALFDNLREIVQMLVPESDHEEVANSLDTQLLVQQVQVAAMDAIRLSNWLATLLTSHCAPMRDSTAAEVTEMIRTGTENNDMETFVDGLEKLFGLLEAMKLDIANHQIRSFRYPLIDGTVDFQQGHFLRAIETQQIDVTKSQRWYRDQTFNHHSECGYNRQKNEASQRFACFMHGLVHLCNSRERKVPLTLLYDQHRIIRLQEDLQDHIQMSICIGVFNQQAYEIAGRRCNPSSMHEELKQRILCLAEDNEGNGGAIADHIEAIGMEITRAAFSMRTASRKHQLSLTAFDFNSTIKQLHDAFQDEERHQDVTEDYLERLEERAMHFAEQFTTLTTVEISDTQKAWAQRLAQIRTSRDICLADWDGMARKLAHIGVVHWRVWRDLCYWERSELRRSDELDLSVTGGSQEQPAGSGFYLTSFSTNQMTEQSKILEEEPIALRIADASIQRHDSGFAEHSEEVELVSNSGLEADLEQTLSVRDRWPRKPGDRRSAGEDLGERRQ